MRIVIGLGVMALASGCGILTGVGIGVDAGVDGPPPPFEECRAERYAFIGESTTAALGLGQFGGGEANRVGMIWVTADEVVVHTGPMPAGGPPQEPSRMVCVEWADGSGMSGPVADDWRLPAAEVVPAGTFPLAPVVVVIMLAALVGASFLAFRERPSPGA